MSKTHKNITLTQQEIIDKKWKFIELEYIVCRVIKESWKPAYGGKNLDKHKYKEFVLSLKSLSMPELLELKRSIEHAAAVFVHNSKI